MHTTTRSANDWRRFYPADIDIVEIDSSDGTDSDLPGPGRILGNIYQRLGHRLESVLSVLAQRKGEGPRAVAVRVRKRAQELEEAAWASRHRTTTPEGDPDSPEGDERQCQLMYVDKEASKQKKDLKRLIHHTKLGCTSIARKYTNLNTVAYVGQESKQPEPKPSRALSIS